MPKEISKQYIAKDHEDDIYKMWEKSDAFKPKGKGKPFTIVIPPPNVTGTLHIGHAVMLAVEDIMIRYHRMRGDQALWVPGTDHAAIATQTVVEKKLKKEQNKRRQDLGREKFLKEIEKFVQTSKDRIKLQMRKMGASCDWSREAYTLDDQRSLAVRTAFKTLYDKKLIYRGDRIVNWCPRCKSTLADDEVEYKPKKTKFYYFKYGPVVIGTARPETKFSDKTIVVHPDDKRYKKLHGKKFNVEWIEGKVKANVIADPVIDPEFGTGAMTITPAHSFEDFDLAQKYNLPIEKIIDEDGSFTKAGGKFAGKNARESRDEIVAILERKGLLDHIEEDYEHNLSVCYRCDTPVEPLPKLQWFVDVNKEFEFEQSKHAPIKGLKHEQKVTLKFLMKYAVESGLIEIVPERFNKTYYQWIDNLRDWCISRQIWFGHRIPVWYCANCDPGEIDIRFKKSLTSKKTGFTVTGGTIQVLLQEWTRQDIQSAGYEVAGVRNAKPLVGIETPKSCDRCGKNLWSIQDPDTLDTWFSSGLWTFSTLGWPKKTKDFETFHPTSVLETGYDILFFWIARMILMSTSLIGEIPFETVYLHGLVRDMKNRKMSKSIGNVIDPLDMSEKYGADAVRVALFIGTSAGTDVKLNEQKIAGYRNFANKIWNATRFVMMNLNGKAPAKPKLSKADEKILKELDITVKQVTKYLEKFDFNHSADTLYHYFWHTFADKIIESQKERLRGDDAKEKKAAQYLLYTILTTCLKMLHPFMPFVTEAVWQELPKKNKSMLITENWPK